MNTVYLVDDEPVVTEGLNKLMDWASIGYECIGSNNNALDAVKAIKKLKPDVVITDIRMPGIDGLEMIRTLKDRGVQSEFVILSGHDEFSYAKKAMGFGVKEYLLKPIDEDEVEKVLLTLNGVIAKKKDTDQQIERMAAITLQRIMNGEDRGNLVERGRFILGMQDQRRVRLLLVKRNVRALNKESIVKILGERYRVNIFEVEEDGLAIVMSDALMKLYDSQFLAEALWKETKGKVYVSTIHEDLSELANAYEDINKLKKQSYYKDEVKCLYYDQKYVPMSVDVQVEHDFDTLFESLKSEVFQVTKEKAEENLERFRAEVAEPSVLQMYTDHLVYGVIESSNDLGCDSKTLIEGFHKVRSETYNLSYSLLKDGVIGYLEVLEATIKKAVQEGVGAKQSDVVKYIHEHYLENLKLKSIAEMFYITPAYLGQLVKKETGYLFNDLIHSLRIAKAKVLLVETSKKVYEIAEECGYGDSDYFVKVFKRFEEQSPNQYRKSCR